MTRIPIAAEGETVMKSHPRCPFGNHSRLVAEGSPQDLLTTGSSAFGPLIYQRLAAQSRTTVPTPMYVDDRRYPGVSQRPLS